jgi:hypothetical protein
MLANDEKRRQAGALQKAHRRVDVGLGVDFGMIVAAVIDSRYKPTKFV